MKNFSHCSTIKEHASSSDAFCTYLSDRYKHKPKLFSPLTHGRVLHIPSQQASLASQFQVYLGDSHL